MPLAHSAYRPSPEVELLSTKDISVDEAVLGLEASLCEPARSGSKNAMHVPGSALINFRQIPNILASLKKDWVASPAAAQASQCFVEVHGRMEVHMHPCFMGERLIEGMRAVAGALLLRFNTVLGCAPLGFKRLEPTGTHGGIVGESPYVHFFIDFVAVGLRPRFQQRLLGRVQEAGSQTSKGINIQILGAFNFFVNKSFVPEDAAFQEGFGWVVRGSPDFAPYFGESPLVLVEVIDKVFKPSVVLPLNFRGNMCADGVRARAPKQQASDVEVPSAKKARTAAKAAKDASSTKAAKAPKRSEAAAEVAAEAVEPKKRKKERGQSALAKAAQA